MRPKYRGSFAMDPSTARPWKRTTPQNACCGCWKTETEKGGPARRERTGSVEGESRNKTPSIRGRDRVAARKPERRSDGRRAVGHIGIVGPGEGPYRAGTRRSGKHAILRCRRAGADALRGGGRRRYRRAAPRLHQLELLSRCPRTK